MAPTSTFGPILKGLRESAIPTAKEMDKRRRAHVAEEGALTQPELGWRVLAGGDDNIESLLRNIKRWENEGVIPEPGMIQRLADALGDRSGKLIASARADLMERQSRGARIPRPGVDDLTESDGRSNRLPVLDGRVVSDDDRARLERIARDAAIAGGIAAMGYFRSVLQPLLRLGEGGNPSTEADVHATIAIVRSLRPAIEAFSRSRDKRCCIYGGMPLFCTAVAIFDGVVPFAAAIYVPTDHVVIYGSSAILGPERASPGRVFEWHVGRGDQRLLEPRPASGGLVVAGHLSRSDPAARTRMLATLGILSSEKDCRGTYLLNSGQLALAWLASREKGLSTFVNTSTSVWDVAAGQVLVEAQGGLVRNFRNDPIEYTKPGKIEVIAAVDREVYTRVRSALTSANAG